MDIVSLPLVQYSAEWLSSPVFSQQGPNPFPPLDALGIEVEPAMEMALQHRSYYSQQLPILHFEDGRHSRSLRIKPTGQITVSDTIRCRGWHITATFQSPPG